jgi:hypothetical protein
MDLGVYARNIVSSNLPELPNTIFMVVIWWLSNGKDMVIGPRQLQTLKTDVRL